MGTQPETHERIETMRLKQLGANKTVIAYSNGVQVFFSYSTPVAARLADWRYVRTNIKYPPTTTKHINQWLDGVLAEEICQSELDKLVNAEY